MKRCCKNIDITDWKTVYPWVIDCIFRHKHRYDFRDLLIQHGLSKDDYYEAIRTYNNEKLMKPIESISQECCRRIQERKLDISPVHIRIMADTTTGKIREIGCESAMQQCFDFIAVYSSMEIFEHRLVKQQCSSIPNRGQIYGVHLIQHYISQNNRYMRYCKSHNIRYTDQCKFHVKLDVKKCYPSAKKDIFMKLFERDCGNKDILWLWNELLSSHQINDYTGFMIGALISQWACQYMLSFIYRYAMSLFEEKRGKKFKSVTHMVMFMDDMLLIGSNRKRLLKAVRQVIEYAKNELGFTIKTNFHIKDMNKEPIDMMGFKVHNKGKITMRSRNYIRSRRMVIRYNIRKRLVYSQVKRLNSYKGFYKYSNSRNIYYKIKKIFEYCSCVISSHEKMRRYVYASSILRAT